MIQTLKTSGASLRDVLFDFSLAKSIPNADLLDEYVRQFPQYADELVDFAVALALDAPQDDEPEPVADPQHVSPAVSRAMSHFQNHLHAVRQAQSAPAQQSAPQLVANPFLTLGRDAFRALAVQLGANALFVSRLRDRQIAPATFTTGFLRLVADKLGATMEDMVAHFTAPANSSAPQFLKANGKPESTGQQSFEEAVRASGLTPEQQQRLLEL
jgi:hypothetical protein